MTRPPFRIAFALLLIVLAAPLSAQQRSGLTKFKLLPGPKPGGGTVKITVGGNNVVEAEKEEYAILQGDVHIEYQDIKMRADKVTYNNKTKDVDAMIGPLWGEKDEAKRIAGYKAVDRYIAEHGLVIPLFQYVQPIVHRQGLKVVPHIANYILPQTMTPA